MGADAAEIVVGVLLVAAWVSVVVINFLKGKFVFGLFALAGGWLGLVGAIRLAKPGSPWAKRYDRDKLALAMGRFPEQARKVDPNWMSELREDPTRPNVDPNGEWPDEDPAVWDSITRKAYKKQHGHWPEQAAG